LFSLPRIFSTCGDEIRVSTASGSGTFEKDLLMGPRSLPLAAPTRPHGSDFFISESSSLRFCRVSSWGRQRAASARRKRTRKTPCLL